MTRIMPKRASAAFCALLALGAAPAASLTGPEGARETYTATRAGDRLRAPLEPARAGPPAMASLDGAVTVAAWVSDAETSPLAALKAFEARYRAAGFETALLCVSAECGGFDFYAALDLLDPPDMALGLHDFAHLTMRKGEAALFSATAGRLGGALRVQAALAEATAAPEPAAPRPARDDNSIGAALDGLGHAVLEGVDFVPGAGEIAPGSQAALDAAAAALEARPELAVAVVGHTDSAGGLKPNLALSKARAQAVAAALEARGVAASRLLAEGAAWLAPRASNATEQGRALNRRVELVAR